MNNDYFYDLKLVCTDLFYLFNHLTFFFILASLKSYFCDMKVLFVMYCYNPIILINHASKARQHSTLRIAPSSVNNCNFSTLGTLLYTDGLSLSSVLTCYIK